MRHPIEHAGRLVYFVNRLINRMIERQSEMQWIALLK